MRASYKRSHMGLFKIMKCHSVVDENKVSQKNELEEENVKQ